MSTKKNLGWLWYFVLLVILSILGALATGYFNLQQQMKREQIDQAITRWRENGPASYRMKYRQQVGESTPEWFEVVVRQGKVLKVLRNDLPLPNELLENYAMGRKLAEIERFFKHDEDTKTRVYLRGYFDTTNGRLLSYTRRVMGGRERLFVEVKEFEAE